MSPLNLRLLAAAAVAGGACWIILAVTSVLQVGGDNAGEGAVELTRTADYLGYGLFAAALALTLPGLLHAHQRGADARLGRIGVLVALAGAGAQCVVISTLAVTGDEPS